METAPTEPAPAGFWARYAAWSLDAACLLPLVALLSASHLSIALARAQEAMRALGDELPRLLGDALASMQSPAALVLSMLVDPALKAATARLELAVADLLFTPLLVYALLALPWSILFERSAWQATPGKRALGLRVASAGDGRRLTAGHALLRFLAAGLSWLSLNLGHALAALPPKHLALHDRLTDTRVLRPAASNRLPAWAKAWLGAQALAALSATAWLFAALQAAMDAALQQAFGPL